MGALPKSRISPRRRRAKRTHYKISAVKLVLCETCGSMHKPHHICPACGSYRGMQVISNDDELV